uniref:Ferredoxin thioredoxin reductase alpha chain domain-containing protein n=1 Tax=Mantoniella antarctica TaxID=81844 RepID=A0A7S0SD67_9CHLO|eukprot:CAMPEP_0181389642 /NCGR_PEP_ID=MMETSP1106-20121128/25024_1 /TAXON_ID=81844 /ORGANISM="Mantoniella antarctica, Strain SL-175" /LENGTH=118 /DNA_ID=CAMNT_0023510427 /DNA_START=31 /DNA_END=387 /DNA_ORIENTATION=-
MSALASSASTFTGRAVRVAVTAPRGARQGGAAVRVRAKLEVGDKVKVTAKVVVFHMPLSRGAATDLQGMVGEVASRADDFNGKYISATFEYKVAIPIPDHVKGKTFIVHMREDEVEVV